MHRSDEDSASEACETVLAEDETGHDEILQSPNSSICISGFLNIVVLGLRGETVLLCVYSFCCFLDLGLMTVVISSSHRKHLEISVNPLEH
jgi:hypothetical protein